ncbi:peptide/nickel transport system permease protein [Nonomuraea solani]|uniref:Peptide/nickel transport system permease protein n=1 Tax=Nonomuraea solani TaxID=1144553 RepID=A0A1H6F350_9ACTN|nr:ABC transporter permease [Nonomuraea solani]SEH03811.1 peptide/nickel transport system permease protein [Nonomuraea solani]
MTWRYAAGRLAEYAAVLAVALTLNFALPRALPGGPLKLFGSPEALARLTTDERAQIATQYGFGKPLPEQFLDYLGGVFTLNLGTSLSDGRPVTEALGEALPWTLLLVGTSIVATALVGVTFGVVGALRRRKGKGSGLLGTAIVLDSFPQFWLGMLLIVLFGVQLQVLPTFGVSGVEGVTVTGVLVHLTLPVSTLTLTGMGYLFLYTRSSLLTVLTSEPIQHAHARGVPYGRLVRRHALRPALLPVHTILMMEIGFLAAGSIVVETVFAYPGLGRLTFDAITARDYPLMQGAFLVLTLMVVLMNALADATYPLLDPRARTGGGR